MELSSRGSGRGWVWLSISVALVSIAQLVLKYAMQQIPAGGGVAAYFVLLRPDYFVRADLPILIGIASYVASVLCWIGTLSRLPLSMAYPSLALSYLLVYLGAVLLPVFHETGGLVRLAGIAMVIFGVWLVSLPGRQANEGASP